jgi:hypothetical protein
MLARQVPNRDWPDRPGVATLITEMDGSMLPVVETAEPVAGQAPMDRRKTRTLSWMEARLCLAHEPGSVSPVFAATTGGVEEAGAQWRQCVIAAGAGSRDENSCFGGRSILDLPTKRNCNLERKSNIWDFYHLSDYVAAAAGVIAANGKKAWMEEKKTWLKQNRWNDLLPQLESALEHDEVPDEQAPVRACHRYIVNRSDCLDYQGALAKGLPIGVLEKSKAPTVTFFKSGSKSPVLGGNRKIWPK